MKERERRYYECIEAALQRYYATVIEELKSGLFEPRTVTLVGFIF